MSEAALHHLAVTPAPQLLRGWTLPAEYYVNQGVFAAELESVFRPAWLFAGHSCELAKPGDFLTFTLGDDSVIIVRDEQGMLRAHHNVCRHRGSRICAEPRGQVKAFVCPYHQWVYGLDGQLRSARLMGTDFDAAQHRLGPATVREVAGLVFVCLQDGPAPDFDGAADAIAAQVGPHDLQHARVVHRAHYRVEANWKTLVENNRECYHCRGSHPEFLQSNFEYGSHGDPRRSETYETSLAESYQRWSAHGLSPDEVNFPDGSWYRVARLPLRDGFRTESTDGSPVAPAMGDVGDEPGSLRLITLPTMWAHANLDYAVTTRLTPIGPSCTEVDVCFLVDADARDEDVDLERLTEVWTATSEQDWELCEANYAGIRSPAYRPGPLSQVVEASVEHFLGWYLDQLQVSTR
jgi:glycine betaine catabolism A